MHRHAGGRPGLHGGSPGFPVTDVSRVTPFELQATHPRDASLAGRHNIRHVGIAYDSGSDLLMFGISTWGDWGSLHDTVFNIYIDNNNDGRYDRILFNSDPGNMVSLLFASVADAQDTFITATVNLATLDLDTQEFVNRSSPGAVHSVVFNNNVIMLAATPASLGIPAGGTLRYKVETCPGSAPLCDPFTARHIDEVTGPLSWSIANQGLNFSDSFLVKDLNGAALPVTWNTANMAANGSLGALLLHHHNVSGARDEILVLDTAPTADLAITQSIAPPAPTPGTERHDHAHCGQQWSWHGDRRRRDRPVADRADLRCGRWRGRLRAASPASGQWARWPTAAARRCTSSRPSARAASSSNVAQVGGSAPPDTVPANNEARARLGIAQQTTLGIAKTAGSPTALVGSAIRYTVTVTNTGSDTAFDVVMTDTFPAYPSLHATSFTASAGTFTPATGAWNIASMAAGASETLTLTLSAPNIAGPLTNQGTIAASNAGCSGSCQALSDDDGPFAGDHNRDQDRGRTFRERQHRDLHGRALEQQRLRSARQPRPRIH